MAIDSVQKAFEQFECETVRVPKAENDAAKAVHPKVREAMKGELDDIVDDFLSGSYSRHVQVGQKLHDIDVILVLDDPNSVYAASASAALDAVQAAARECDLIRLTAKRVRSVRTFLHDYDFHVDLVVALKPTFGDGLLLARHLPDEGYDDWSQANPRGQREAAWEKNERCGDMYIPAVRIVKFWNAGVGKPLRSYHAESVLYHALDGPIEYAEAVVRFFDAAYDALAPGVLTPDPGEPTTYVDARLEDEARRKARERVEKAREAAHEAFEIDDVGDALDAWVGIFGSSFPAPSPRRTRSRPRSARGRPARSAPGSKPIAGVRSSSRGRGGGVERCPACGPVVDDQPAGGRRARRLEPAGRPDDQPPDRGGDRGEPRPAGICWTGLHPRRRARLPRARGRAVRSLPDRRAVSAPARPEGPTCPLPRRSAGTRRLGAPEQPRGAVPLLPWGSA
jgi:hypothetical protein